MTEEQFEQVKKKTNSQMKTVTKWAKETQPEETIIFIKGIAGRLGARSTKGCPSDILCIIAQYLRELSKKLGVPYNTIICTLLLETSEETSTEDK